MKYRTEIKVGIVVFAAVVAFMVLAVRINVVPLFGERGYHYFANFDNATGIILKSPVVLSGVNMGRVGEIKLVNGKARVTIGNVDTSIVLYENAIARIRDRGVLGERFIEILPGDAQFPRIPNGGTIKHTVSVSQVDQIFGQFDKATDIFPTIDKVVKNIEKMTNEFSKMVNKENSNGSLQKVMENVQMLTESVNEMVQSVSKIIENSNEQIGNSSKNIEKFTKDLSMLTDHNVTKINDIVDSLAKMTESLEHFTDKGDSGLSQTLESVDRSAKKLDESLESLKNIFQKVERGEGSVGKLLNDEEIANKLTKTIDSVNAFVDSVSRVETIVGYHGEYLMDRQEVQNFLQLKIQTRPDKYFLFELVDQPEGVRTTTDSTITVGDNAPVTVTTVTTSHSVAFSAQFAKRFYDLNMRFGLIRSYGGVGLDYYLFGDRLGLSVEAFDFRRPQGAHLRSYLTLNVNRYISINGGVDDWTNNDESGPSGYFVGAGLHFSDEDIKAIIASFPLSGK